MTRKKKKFVFLIGLIILSYFTFNAIKIYRYSFEYSETNCDVAIVLGAGSNKGIVSPVFKERINHSVYLYKKGVIRKIIFTGGKGKGQKSTDSEIAKLYAIETGIPIDDILIETKSRYTIENFKESKIIMDSLGLSSALIVSDPLHMKRSINLARNQNIECKPSPTLTTMYKTTIPKFKSLLYETFYYSLGQIARKN
ncbi:MAG: YdcF family protein [Bacteroidetes bacterium]|nr:YdcF family protein [Bacteroidota bacterium]